MTTSIISLALLSFLSHLIILTAQPPDHICFNDRGNYTNTSAYHTNLNALLSNFTSDTKTDYGFYTSSYGQNSDRVNALGLCRGDIKPDPCRSCLNNATILLPKLCPNQKEAFGFYDFCFFRYSNRSMFGIYQDPDLSVAWNNPTNAPDADKYNDALEVLMKSLKSKAVAGDSHRKFAAGNATVQSQTVYGLVQCTPDLSKQDCDDCLAKAISDIPRCCQNKIGGRVIKLSCNIRFEKDRFYDPTVIDPIQSSPPLASSTNVTSPQGAADSTNPTSSIEGTSCRLRNDNRSTIVVIMVVLIGAFITL